MSRVSELDARRNKIISLKSLEIDFSSPNFLSKKPTRNQLDALKSNLAQILPFMPKYLTAALERGLKKPYGYWLAKKNHLMKEGQIDFNKERVFRRSHSGARRPGKTFHKDVFEMMVDLEKQINTSHPELYAIHFAINILRLMAKAGRVSKSIASQGNWDQQMEENLRRAIIFRSIKKEVPHEMSPEENEVLERAIAILRTQREEIDETNLRTSASETARKRGSIGQGGIRNLPIRKVDHHLALALYEIDIFDHFYDDLTPVHDANILVEQMVLSQETDDHQLDSTHPARIDQVDALYGEGY